MNLTDYHLNPLVSFLDKAPKLFTKADIARYVRAKEIRMINFRYVAADGRLKCLNLPITNSQYLNDILSYGERVDGSSLFPYIEAGASDLYVVPRFCTAFVDPFADIPTLNLLCSYFTKDGLPLESAPEYTLHKAHQVFQKSTGLSFETMGELEFYVTDKTNSLFPTSNQKGYHESAPFNKFEAFRCQAIHLIAKAGGQIKYGHSEVGNFEMDGHAYEQNEIEFLVQPAEAAADQLVIAKWIIRTLAHQHGLHVTFAPKITSGKAGSGLHFHTRMLHAGASVMIRDGVLSPEARRAIAGYMTCAPSLTAFGNTNPTSYFRLVPHQEAPTTICWGDRNRSVLVRVPLGWLGQNHMLSIANPLEPQTVLPDVPPRVTVEMRCPDGSADVYQMIAGLIVAARYGLEMDAEKALSLAEQTYVDVNIHQPGHEDKTKHLQQLPASCYESADRLQSQRAIYEQHGVFSPYLIDGIIQQLKGHDDRNIRERIKQNPALMQELVQRFYHCG
ncbi:MAG: glutamine synthetase family protein [Bacteroidales bacterium]|nr:glutamine synthetase family protein [Bacteroidales bacterium]MCL2737979.1 glutamine synthetase family protein [Bacteroidales bacterium]